MSVFLCEAFSCFLLSIQFILWLFNLLKTQEIVFLIFFCFIVFKSIKKNGLISLYTIFLLLCFVFNFSRYYLDIIDFYDVVHGEFFGIHIFTVENITLNIVLMQLSMFLIDFGYYLLPQPKISTYELNNNQRQKQIILFGLGLLFPFAFLGNFYIFKYVLDNGYYVLAGKMNNLGEIVPLPFRLADYIFKLLFYTSFYYKFNKKQQGIIFVLYFFNSIMIGLRGSRGAFLFPLVFFAFLIIHRKLIKINFSKIIIFLIFGYLFFQISSSVREIGFKSTSILYIINFILLGQSLAILLPFLYTDAYISINAQKTIPFIIGDVLSNYFAYPYAQTGMLNHLITENKQNTLGYSMFPEIYDAGLFGIVIAFFVGWFIKCITNNLDRNRKFNLFFIIAGMSIIWMPRDCILRILFKTNIMFMVVSIVVYLLLGFSSGYMFNSNYKNNKLRHTLEGD